MEKLKPTEPMEPTEPDKEEAGATPMCHEQFLLCFSEKSLG